MNISTIRISFDPDTSTGEDARDVSSLCDRIRKRFKAAVRVSSLIEEDGYTAIVVAYILKAGESAHQVNDKILRACEESGFGRVDDFTAADMAIERFESKASENLFSYRT